MPFTLDQFKILSDKTSLLLFILKKDGKIVACNNKGDSILSQGSSIKGTYITDYMIDDDVSVFMNTISNLSINNPIANESYSFTSKNKEIASLKFDFTLDKDLIYTTGIDVTEEYEEHRALLSASKLTKTGAWYFNPRINKLYWSKESYDIAELDPSIPITREKEMSFFTENSKKRVKNCLNDLIENKIPYKYTEKIITEKGNKKWIKVIAKPILYKDKVIFVNGAITDVTSKHHYIERLKHSEETKHLALKGIKSGLFDYNISKNEIFYSADFKKMLGLSLDQDFVSEGEFMKMIHPNDIDNATKKHVENLKKDGNHYHNSYRLKHLKGDYRYYEVHGFRKKNKAGRTTRMIGNLIDVHHKKINEKIISESRNRLLAMINNGFTYIILLDIEGKILMTDDKSSAIIKKDFNVDINQTPTRFIDVMPINFKNSFAHEFNEALKGRITKKEVTRITSKGNIQWLESKYTPVMSRNHTVNSVLVSFLDITEQKLAEKAIKDSHIKQQELNNLKSNILSNFSHEIRTPLNGIMTISKLLGDEKNETEKEKLIHYLEESKDRLLSTVENLSSFNEIETARNNLNFQKTDINYTVETSYREYKHLAEGKNLDYKLELDSQSPKANIDPDLFKSAINKIIHNAIKYTPEGSITITIKSKKTKNNAYISVTDTGIGINNENKKRIFEPFMQESVGLDRKYEGTGIGLSLSKKYIEILGGKIKLKSKVGSGSQFEIIIPKIK